MQELLKANDPVLLSYVESLLKGGGIHYVILDQNMSILEGSIGVLPRRVMVEQGQLEAAREILKDADLEKWDANS
ncbi:MAG: DUF2007 domain-containing protein [Hyphomicrobiaceae bacterium]